MTPLQGWCPLTSVEKVLLAVGVKAGHGNIAHVSCMIKGVVFVKQPEVIILLTESGISINDEFKFPPWLYCPPELHCPEFCPLYLTKHWQRCLNDSEEWPADSKL